MNLPTDSDRQTPEQIAAHERAMAEKAEKDGVRITRLDKDNNETVVQDGGTGDDPAASGSDDKPQRPDWCPEKFWDAEKGEVNAEALAKSYGELESNRAAPKDEPEDTETSEDDETDDDGEAAPFAEVKAAAEAEFEKNGELSDDTYKALEKRGFSREMVDQYIAGAGAVTSQAEDRVFTEADTDRATYEAATAWAADNLDEGEKEKFNAALSTHEGAVLAVKDLIARYQREADIEPSNTIHGGSGNSGSGFFKSRGEMVAAMSDPRYKTDAAFRAEVAGKIDRAAKHGINLYGS